MVVFWLYFALKKEHKVIEKVLHHHLEISATLFHTFFQQDLFINFEFLAKQRTKGEQYKEMRRRRKKTSITNWCFLEKYLWDTYFHHQVLWHHLDIFATLFHQLWFSANKVRNQIPSGSSLLNIQLKIWIHISRVFLLRQLIFCRFLVKWFDS